VVGRLAALAPLLLLCFAVPVTGQETPDVPAGDATIRGRVLHGGTGAPIPGSEVALYALPAEAPPGLRRTTSDAKGDFVFADVDADPRTTYLVGARHQGVPYPGARVQFEAGENERTVEVRVADVTSDVAAARLVELRMRIDWLGGRLQIAETLVFENTGERTIVVPPGARSGGSALTQIELPAGAGALSGPLGVVPDGLVRADRMLSWWGPLLPGRHEIEYAYEIAGATEAAALDRALPAGGVRVTVLSPQGGPELSAPALRPGDSISQLGRSYTPWQGEVAGGPLSLALRLPEARVAPDAVDLAEVRIIGELDEAAWSGREEHVLSVTGTAPVVGAEGRPLWVVPLPPEARDVRFGIRESSATLTPTGDGGLAVLGPLAPGETTLDISYRLRGGDPFVLAREFSSHLPLLSIYLADTGRLGLDSNRLHNRRSVRTSDRTYLHLEAFEVEAGERVALEVTRLPRRTRLPKSASLLAMGAFAAVAIFFLVAPLRTTLDRGDALPPEDGGARRERDSLYVALADLEHDHETGKIDDGDYAAMRADLRGRALELLESERRGTSAPQETRGEAPSAGSAEPGVATADRFCRACGHAVEPDDRFCARCGKPLGPEAPA